MTRYTPGQIVEVYRDRLLIGGRWVRAEYVRTDQGFPAREPPTVLVRCICGLFRGCLVRYSAEHVRPVKGDATP